MKPLEERKRATFKKVGDNTAQDYQNLMVQLFGFPKQTSRNGSYECSLKLIDANAIKEALKNESFLLKDQPSDQPIYSIVFGPLIKQACSKAPTPMAPCALSPHKISTRDYAHILHHVSQTHCPITNMNLFYLLVTPKAACILFI